MTIQHNGLEGMAARFLNFVTKFSAHFHCYRKDISDKARQYLSGLMQAGGRKVTIQVVFLTEG